MKLIPPIDGLEYNGAKASADGVEVAAADVDALRAAGWIAATPTRSQETHTTIPATPEETADETAAENED